MWTTHRFKVLGFREEEKANTAKANLLEELKNANGNESIQDASNTGQVLAAARTANQQNRDEIWEDHDKSVQENRPSDNEEDPLTKEFKSYFATPNQDRKTCDPIAWWNSEGKAFPNVRKLALKYLIIPGKYA